MLEDLTLPIFFKDMPSFSLVLDTWLHSVTASIWGDTFKTLDSFCIAGHSEIVPIHFQQWKLGDCPQSLLSEAFRDWHVSLPLHSPSSITITAHWAWSIVMVGTVSCPHVLLVRFLEFYIFIYSKHVWWLDRPQFFKIGTKGTVVFGKLWWTMWM